MTNGKQFKQENKQPHLRIKTTTQKNILDTATHHND